jgi:hypothetical protein
VLLVRHVLLHPRASGLEWLGRIDGADDIADVYLAVRRHGGRSGEHVYSGELEAPSKSKVLIQQTKAVFSVPFTYSVPARIGLALSKVGTSISITSLSDLVLLGVVWFVVNIRPVREFCVFAAVLIVTDWFMLNTFFLTVSLILPG